MDEQLFGALNHAFVSYASFGTSTGTNEMDNSHFTKMLKESKVIDKQFTTTDADLLFNRIKSKGARKITLAQFMSTGLPEIAKKKKTTEEAIAQQIARSVPQSSGTVADNVKFHDDKTLYTGVYKQGGPTNVDHDSGSLGALVDRRVDNDTRGAPTGLK